MTLPTEFDAAPRVTMVICTYTDERHALLTRAIQTLVDQDMPVAVMLVIDHNPAFAERLRQEWPQLPIVENRHKKGLSGARNTAIDECTTEILGFLDDDGEVDPDWVRTLLSHLTTDDVLAVGSFVSPRWEVRQPSFLAEEFFWVVGCSYRGLPTQAGPIRNPSGGAMIVRCAATRAVGGFRTDLGRVGRVPLGCEETDLFIRLGSTFGGGHSVFVPEARMRHFVPEIRCRWSYYLRRCYAEGLSKAFVGPQHHDRAFLRDERRHLVRTIPAAVGREARRGHGQAVLGLVLGVFATALGYASGRFRA